MADESSGADPLADPISGMLTQAVGSAVNYGFGAMAASKAYDRSKNMITRGPTYQRIGLKAGGYNPILALTGGRMPTAPGVQQGRTQGGQFFPNQVSQRGLIAAQTRAAQLNAASMEGPAAESMLLKKWLLANPAWPGMRYRTKSLPDNIPAAAIKYLSGSAEDFFNAAKEGVGGLFRSRGPMVIQEGGKAGQERRNQR